MVRSHKIAAFGVLLLSGCPDGPGRSKPTAPVAPVDTEIVFRAADGRTLRRADLVGVTGTVNWELRGGVAPPRRAVALHQAGREAGESGRSDEALRLFEEAQKLAPDWAYPLYDAAWAHLLRGDPARALQAYRAVDRLEPRGFFTTKAAIDTLRREQEGLIEQGLYLALVTLEWSKDAATKRETLERILERSPAFPAAWKAISALREDDDAKLEAIESGLAYQPDPDTRGVLLVNKALIWSRRGKRKQALTLLGALALDRNSTRATQQLAKWTLATLLEVTPRSGR